MVKLLYHCTYNLLLLAQPFPTMLLQPLPMPLPLPLNPYGKILLPKLTRPLCYMSALLALNLLYYALCTYFTCKA